jgi:Carboxypeptidase regulatory-like domain
MHFRSAQILLLVLSTFAFVFCVNPSAAQNAAGSLRGQVLDPSGAAVGGAVVLVTTSDGTVMQATTNRDGIFEVHNLPPGKYGVKVIAESFALFEQQNIDVAAGPPVKLNVPLKIEEQRQKVEVTDSNTRVDISPENNASMVALKGKDLEALSDDPDELQAELQALAGPSAGPNGGQIYIDGFTGGQLPPKDSIREIRVNQNPFSAEYDRLGYGRIEILTKPGTDQFHGQLFLTGSTAAFNSRNPLEQLPAGTTAPGYETTQFSGSVGGPLGKKASFFFNLERRDINDLSIVSAQILDPNFNVTSFSDAVPNPRTRINLSPRLDYQLAPTNTLTVRYQYERNNESNNGIGQFNLPSTGYNLLNTENVVQVSDTQVLNAKTINETRFRFDREVNAQIPLSSAVTLFVIGAFTNGGNSTGHSTDTLDSYELQNYTSMSLGKHYLKFGLRLRVNHDNNVALPNSNGTFIFGARQNPAFVAGQNQNCTPSSITPACPSISGLAAFQLTEQGLAAGMPLSAISAAGGGASQYLVAMGTAHAAVNYYDLGPYFQDDWRIRPNMTLSYGLRFETQDDFSSHVNVAPRLGYAWGLGGGSKKGASPKTVLRAGFGVFYDRFGYDLVLQQERLNGIVQQQFTFANPSFFVDSQGGAPPLSQLLTMLQPSAVAPTIYAQNPHLHTPYTIQTGVSVERQLTKNANFAVTYLNSRGIHQFFTENINAPVCSGFPCDPMTSPHPLGGFDNIYQYQSEGIFKQNQLIVNGSIRIGARLSLSGYYTLNYANSDTAGPSSFPSSFNDVSLDYGRAAFDIRHRLFLSGPISLPHGFRLIPFLLASSGVPYTITTGQDLNGDSIFNDRPSFASSASNPKNVVTNRFGSFDLVPQPGETLAPVNSLTGTPRFTLNLRVSKSFGFGKKTEGANPTAGQGGPGSGGGTFGRGPGERRGGGFGGGGRGGADSNTTGQRYSLTFAAAARNLFNYVNFATPIGNLSSPFFGEANALAGQPYSSSTANRRIDLQVTFTF